MTGFQIKRIYENASASDGYRVLIDRLWPRGIKKEMAKLDEWNKEVAPSTELRKQFNHKPERFDTFSALYRDELATKQADLNKLRNLAKKTRVTLLYAAKDVQVNHAVVLKEVLEEA